MELILRKLAEGASESDLLDDYSHLTGAASVAHEEVVLPDAPIPGIS